MIVKDYLKNKADIVKASFGGKIQTFFGLGAVPTWLSSNYISMYNKGLNVKQGSREMITDDTDEVDDIIEYMFTTNYDKYQHLFDLFAMEYNPLWNVDGTERTQRAIDGTRTSSATGSSTTTYNVTDTIAKTDTRTLNLTDTTDMTEVETLATTDTTDMLETTTHNTTEGNTTTDSKTTYDAATFYDTDKSISSKTNTGTDSVDTVGTVDHTGTDTKDTDGTITHTGTDTNNESGTVAKTGTEGTASTSGGTDTTATDEDTLITRTGNIGVTSSQSLFSQEINVSDMRKFIEYVILDVIREVAYTC